MGREATTSTESILNREAPPDTRPTRTEVTYTQEGEEVEKSISMGPPPYDGMPSSCSLDLVDTGHLQYTS